MILKNRPKIPLKIFEPPKPDIFDRTELDPSDKVLFSHELKSMIDKAVQEALDAMKAAMPAPMPQKEIVREIRVEVPKKDTREFVEKSALEAALKKISDLEKKLEETDEAARTPRIIPSGHGGPGVIGIPNPGDATAAHVLTVVNTSDGKKAQWKVGGGGADISGYTINDLTTLKNLPADASLDELRQVLGTLITELQA
jgi:hypothetical protein